MDYYKQNRTATVTLQKHVFYDPDIELAGFILNKVVGASTLPVT